LQKQTVEKAAYKMLVNLFARDNPFIIIIIVIIITIIIINNYLICEKKF
jgi:hypothetical protein